MLEHLNLEKVLRAKTLVQNVLKRQILPRNFTEERCIMGHPIRTLYPSKIIVSNKLLGLLGFGSGSFYMHEMTIPVTIGIIKRCN